MRSSALLAGLAVLCLAAPAARAQYAPPYSHQGFYLRLDGGLGYLSGTADFDNGTSATAKGGAGYLGLSIGGAVSPDVVVYGELWGMSAVAPTVQYGGFSGVARDQTLNFGGLGLGIGTFFSHNVFFGVSLDLTRLGVTNSDGSSSNSDVGLALTATLGKQFWVTERVGLGFGLKLIGGGNRDNNNNANSTTYKTFAGVGVLALTFG